jgi:hypothetical protein
MEVTRWALVRRRHVGVTSRMVQDETGGGVKDQIRGV